MRLFGVISNLGLVKDINGLFVICVKKSFGLIKLIQWQLLILLTYGISDKNQHRYRIKFNTLHSDISVRELKSLQQ